jgi:hypothetical protein
LYNNRGEFRAERLRRGKSEVRGGLKENENTGLMGRLKEDRTLKRRREREDRGFLEKFNSRFCSDQEDQEMR